MTDSGGWVKVYRKTATWEWAKDPYVSHVWYHLLLGCNFRHSRFAGYDIKPGQWAVSINRLSEITGLSVNCIKTCLKKLKSTSEITSELIRVDRHFLSLITINKWDEYQKESTSESTSDRTSDESSDQLVTGLLPKNLRKKEVKKERNNTCAVEELTAAAINELNKQTGTNYSASNKTALKAIRKLLDTGYELSHIREVISFKTKEWGQDQKMKKYLRPQTLFGSKFEEYLDSSRAGEAIVKHKGPGHLEFDDPDHASFFNNLKERFGEKWVIEYWDGLMPAGEK